MADMVDDLLRVGGWFDWIGPTVSKIQETFGGMRGCAFSPPPGYDPLTVRDVFRAFGLKTGAMFGDPLGDDVYITVSDDDAAYSIVEGLWAGRVWIERSWTGKVKRAGWTR